MQERELEKKQQEDERFRFRGGVLALDLVNTEKLKRGKPFEALVTPQDVAQWWQAACEHHPQWQREVQGSDEAIDANDTKLLDALKTLRAALRRIFTALVENTAPRQEDIDVLNNVLRTGHWFTQLSPEGDLLPVYQTEEAHSRILLSCALSALHLIREGEHSRLHRCESDRCILFFYDTTRSATRRWCSTSCMDRARSLQRYRQAKQAAHAHD
ncbi:RNA-binding protein [Reticulibacter mediterranei]|uniref:RNA-binding protein n=1 Tax=Reticulibacter mediterranei TaxID=2778369 RepID=A0A8J3IYT4_9CHLR|nr:ABATE domain-containing protein [Reticulibacter mediterranei]GHO97716.1 RNA-binding protein [Reticulibacter mediterranei]